MLDLMFRDKLSLYTNVWGAVGVVRVLAFHQYGPGSIPVPFRMWVEFVALVVSVFSVPLSTKTIISKFQLAKDRGPVWKPANVFSPLNIVFYSFLIYL